ncbi:MAG: DNA modification methylase [Anaerolineae bacterium]|nr:DNA modification methylase [Phycisphaerae bacterium]
MKLKPHKFAEMLPMMSEPEFESLKADIAANGQRDPIELFHGDILDGRNRYRAVLELKLRPITRKFKGTDADAIALVYSRANHRNMTDTQKACAAVNFLPHFEDLAKSRMSEGGKGKEPIPTHSQSRDLAGGLFGVSGRYVSDARVLFERNAKLFRECFEGKQVITRAIREVKRADRVQQAKAASLSGRAFKAEDFSVIVGDAVKKMTTLPRGKFRLIFTDPPYNFKFKYLDDPTRDDLSPTKYYNMIRRVVQEGRELLTMDGTLCLMMPEEHVIESGQIIKDAGLFIRRLIVWHESFGQAGKFNFGRTCRFIWYATKHASSFMFDAASILTESKRTTIYNDKRANPDGKVPDALWDFSRLCGTFDERLPDPGIPTQLPVALVTRAVKCFTEVGDSILDPFGGTGTTARAALRAGRKCVLIERSPRYAEIIKRELLRMSIDGGLNKQTEPEWAKRERAEIKRAGDAMLKRKG